ncbi:MAG: glycosyltransferase [Chloroflexi bacterium]|nr:glycosyltransferase [Chloroflexota bacterium]
MPRISVITPTYNRAQLTAQAVQSVLDQTFEDFEMIVIDDGSKDDTEAVIGAISDPRLKYIKRANGGAAAASNTGLELAQGEWIAFLDSDDLFLPNKFALQMAAIEQEPAAGVIYGRYYGMTSTGIDKKLVGGCYAPYPLADLLMGPVFHWSTSMFRRSILQETGYFDLNFWVGEDWELTLRTAITQCKFVCVPEALAKIRIQDESLSRDIHRHETCGQDVLQKTFNNPDFPSDLQHLKNRALASHLIRVAASAYLSETPALGTEPLARALATDPTLKHENKAHLIAKLFNYAMGLSLEDPAETLSHMSANLPGDPQFTRHLERALWGRYHLNMAFQAYEDGDRKKCRTNAIKAVSLYPQSLKNRGLVSIFARSIIGGSLFSAKL